MPKGKKSGRPSTWSRRQPIDGMRFRVRTGIPWRDLSAEYGPWSRACDLFRRWQRDGIWQRILTALHAQADAKDLITWDINVDSTVVRAHQHAPGARKRGTCRTCGPWARTLARRPDHQAALGCGATAEAHVDRHHGGAAGRLPAVRGRPGPCPGSPAGAGQATRPAQAGSRGQGIRFPQEPRLSRRPTAEVRPGRLPRAPCGGMRHQSPQEAPSGCHEVRQVAVRYEATVLVAAINEWL